MEPIAELKRICQTTAKKDRSNVYMRYVCRSVSIYITRWLLPHRQVTANMASFAMIVTGSSAALLLMLPAEATFLAGALLLQCWYILDCVDGEIARYRYYEKTGQIVIDKKDANITGLFYDIMNHYIVHTLVALGAGFGLMRATGAPGWMLAGIAAALGQLLMMAEHDGKARAVYAHLRKYRYLEVTPPAAGPAAPKKRSPLHVAFMIVHYTMTYPTVMNLFGLTGLAGILVPGFDGRGLLLLYLAAGSLTVAFAHIARTIRGSLVDEEFRTAFTVREEALR